MTTTTLSVYFISVLILVIIGIVIFHFVLFDHLLVVLKGIDLVSVTPEFTHSLYWFLLAAWVIGWFGARLHPMLVKSE